MTSLTRALAGLALSTAISACAQNYRQAYQNSHPDWTPSGPQVALSVQETVASLYVAEPYNSMPSPQIDVARLIITATKPTLTRVSIDDLEKSADGAAKSDYVLVAQIECYHMEGQLRFAGSALGWYQIGAGELESWNHPRFGYRCEFSRDIELAANFESQRELVERVVVDVLGSEKASSLMPPERR